MAGSDEHFRVSLSSGMDTRCFYIRHEGRERKIPPIPSTLQEARALLSQLTKIHEDKLGGFDDTVLRKQTTITLSAGTLTEPGVEILHRIIGHEAHHKGQLFTYARLLNVAEPPFYVDLSVRRLPT